MPGDDSSTYVRRPSSASAERTSVPGPAHRGRLSCGSAGGGVRSAAGGGGLRSGPVAVVRAVVRSSFVGGSRVPVLLALPDGGGAEVRFFSRRPWMRV